jgi:hypothetical protein
LFLDCCVVSFLCSFVVLWRGAGNRSVRNDFLSRVQQEEARISNWERSAEICVRIDCGSNQGFQQNGGCRFFKIGRFFFFFCFQESITITCRRLLIELDTAVLKYQQVTGTNGGKKKWSNVLSPRRPESPKEAVITTSDAPPPVEAVAQPPAEGAVDDDV